MKRFTRVFVVVAIAGLVAAGGVLTGAVGADSPEAKSTIKNAAGDTVGVVKLSQEQGYVSLKASVQRLAPGFHGVHVHGIGDCDPFGDAGSHLGTAESGQSHDDHDGDLPVLLVMGDGTGHLRVTTDRFTIAELLSGNRTAFVIHALADNYTDPASGAAGARIACGVIEAG